MKNLSRLGILALILAVPSAFAADPWRTQASAIAGQLAASIETLDEVLHDVYEKQNTAPFKEAIEEMHHIEDLVTKFSQKILTQPYPELCADYQHLYHDLVNIRQFLIDLGLQNNPMVVQRWNEMVGIYNNRLLPYFRTCGSGHSAPADETTEGRLAPL